MSTEKAQSPDASPGEDASKPVEKPVYEYGARLLEDKPDLTAAGFAGALFGEFGIAPEPATDLYDELTDEDDDTTVSGETDEDSTEKAASPDATPTPEAEGGEFDVGESAKISVYEDSGDRVAGQLKIDGVRTDPDEFKRFHELLTEDTPDGYTPYYIKCKKGEKGPVGGIAWSDPANSLSTSEAVEWVEAGGNIGIVGTKGDCLVDLDVDDPDLVAEEDIKQTLRATSRSRGGYHAWYFGDGEIPNIDSDAGEIRTDNQYVVAPGSHVPINLDDPDDPDLDDIPPDERANVGRYSVAQEQPVSQLEYDEIPPVYREEHEARQEVIEERPERRDDPPEPTGDGDNRSAIFDLDITDITGLSWGYRGVNPTGHHSNDHQGNDRYFKIDREHGARDFKDNVSYSPASWALADAGERDPAIPNGGLTDREYFVYWQYCKENNLVPTEDPIPRRALVWVAIDSEACGREDVEDGWKLPADAHNDALDTVREKYGLEPGRESIGGETRSEYYDVDLVAYADGGDPWTDPDTMLRAALRARDDGAVSEHAGPPKLALLPLRRDVLEQQPSRDMSSGTKALLEDLFHELTVEELDDVLDE